MTEKERVLTTDQVKAIVKQLIIKTEGNIVVSRNSSSFGKISEIAEELGYGNIYQNIYQFVEEIWKYVLTGILAPGSIKEVSGGGNYIFFPYLHLTEKGQKEMDKWQY